MLRIAVSWLVACAIAALVGGCGNSNSPSRGSASRPLTSAEIAYADAVNLRAGDVPGLAASRFAPRTRTRHAWWLYPEAMCERGAHAGEEVTGVASPSFAASLEHGGVLTLVPLERVNSTVYPMVSPATALRALQAAVSARGRATVITLDAMGDPHPVASATERRLLMTLFRRAKLHKP